MSNINKYLEGLNEEQTRATTSIDGAVRLIAGAGSGKTFTLTRRVAYICDYKNIHPSRVLSLTFTNKAAGEMRSRTAKLMGLPEEEFNMSTFHSLALDIVKEHCEEVFGWTDFKIGNMSAPMLVPQFFKKNRYLVDGLSDTEVEELQSYLLGKVNYALKNEGYVKWMTNIGGSINLTPVDDLIDYMKKDIVSTNAKKNAKNNINKATETLKIKGYIEKYESLKLDKDWDKEQPYDSWVRAIIRQKSGMCTFDDLIFCALYILKNYPEIKDLWSNKFDYIQVDEFQDTDMKQLDIVKLLYERHGNLFVVGDPDQSIYLFRGAEPTLFNNLDDYIPNLKTIFMITNYRSSDEIVKISNKVIEMNKNRIPKTCVSKAGQGSKVELIFGDKNKSLVDKEFEIINKLLLEGVEPDNIAVLYRSTKDNSTKELQEKLKEAGIPVVSTLANENIYYNITYNLCRYNYCKDETFLINAAQYFAGDTSHGGGNLVDLSKFDNYTLTVDSLFSLFNSFKEKYSKKTNEPVSEYAKFLNAKSENITAIKNALDYWENLSEDDKKASCIVDLLLGEAEPLDGKGIKIMTMHKSKGLEFSYVFVNGLSKNIMDSRTDNAEACEEKARLAYVAYSRAKNQLYLGCDSIDDMHGVLGQVCDAPVVKLEEDLKDDLKGAKDSSISDYEKTLDTKTNIVYYRLVVEKNEMDTNGKKKKDVKGYRCTYSLHGERVAFHAKLEDLERLDCVPKRQEFLVKVGRDITVVKYENNHCYAFDELNKAIKVIDLVHDKDIKAVFMGSNNGYAKDIKDRDYLDTILQDWEKEKQSRNPVIPKIKEDEGTLKKHIIPEKKDIKVEKPQDLTYVLLYSKNKGEFLGIRMIRADKKYKDISVQEAKARGITPKDCTDKKYISILSDFNYSEFIDMNKTNKQNSKLKYRVIEVDFVNNKCMVLEVATGKTEEYFIDDIVNGLKKGKVYLSNPSSLLNWKYWKK